MGILKRYTYLSALVLGPVCFGQYHFELKNASKNYDVKINVENCFDDQCRDKGTVELQNKKTGGTQTLISQDLVISLPTGEKPTTANVVQLNKDRRVLVFDDFNFDGTEDVAIRNGSLGNYGGPSYDVYVYNVTKKELVKSEELTEVASSYLDIFDTDPKRKRLVAYAKSGCCRFFTTEYRVIPNKGLDKVSNKEEDFSEEGRVKVTTNEKVNRKWMTKTKIYSQEQYDKQKVK